MNIEELIHMVIDLSDEEKYQQALEICDKIIDMNPDYDRVYFERGMIYLNQENDQLALLDFEKLLQINPDYPGAKDWYSKTLSDLGEKSTAAMVKWDALRSLPEGKYGMGVSPKDWADCAQYFMDADQYELAMSVLEEYFKQYQSKVNSYQIYETAPLRVYVKLLLSQHKHVLALAAAEKAIESKHAVPVDYELYIKVLIANNQIEKAKMALDTYVSEIHHGYEPPHIIELKKSIN